MDTVKYSTEEGSSLTFKYYTAVFLFCDHIHKPSFFSQLTNGHNKLECYITLGWKHLPVINTLAYWDHCKLRSELGVVNTVPDLLHFIERLVFKRHLVK